MLPTNRLTFVRGINNSAPHTDLADNELRDAVNLDITTEGHAYARADFSAIPLPNARCLQGFGDFGLCAQGTTLLRVAADLTTTIVGTGLHPSNPISYAEFAGLILFTDGVRVGVYTGSIQWLGMATPPSPQLAASPVGGLAPGRYGVAYSFIDANGYESGTSEASFIDVTAGIELVTLPAAPAGAAYLRVYTTTADGDQLYFSTDLPAGMLGPILIGSAPTGRMATTRYMTQMSGGRLIAGYNGRVYVAKDDVLLFSEPLLYGLMSPRHNFMSFGSEIVMLQVVVNGLFVGTRDALYFVVGDGPAAATVRFMAPPPIPFSGVQVDASMLPDPYDKQGGVFAMWLTAKGYYLGTPNGDAIPLQTERIQVDTAAAVVSTVMSYDGIKRVVTTVE